MSHTLRRHQGLEAKRCYCTGRRCVVCWADWLNHAILSHAYNHHVCQRHEQAISDETIIRRFFAA